MVRTKLSRFNRPESTPNLAFERFDEEGNTEGAVIYYPDFNVLEYNKTQNFKAEYDILESSTIKDVFLTKNSDRMMVNIDDGEGDFTTMVCFAVVVPDKEQKAKLTAKVQTTGTRVIEEIKSIQQSIKRIRTIVETLNTDVKTLCPGFDLATLDEEAEFGLPLSDGNYNIDKLDAACIALLDESEVLAVAEPFSKKRKFAAD